MGLEMSADYRLRWMDFDRFGRMQPAAILDIFQDMATAHADELGIGHDAMLEKGVFWAVVRSKLQVVEEPEHFQVVTVRTWPHSLSRFSFVRDFTMCDARGRLLVKASQEWVLMDAKTRKFVSAKDGYDGPCDFCEDRAFQKKARKIPLFAEGNLPAYAVVPGYCDIDVNGHVNNARYANYIACALNPNDEVRIDTMQIDYRYEVLPGRPLRIETLAEEDRFLFKGVNETDDVAFTCLLEPKR